MELKEIKKWDRILWIVIVAGAVLGFFPTMLQWVFLGIGILGIVARMVLLLKYWRCPDCGQPLPVHGMRKLTTCPACEMDLFGE